MLVLKGEAFYLDKTLNAASSRVWTQLVKTRTAILISAKHSNELETRLLAGVLSKPPSRPEWKTLTRLSPIQWLLARAVVAVASCFFVSGIALYARALQVA